MTTRVRKPLKKANSLSNRVKNILTQASSRGEIDVTISDVVLGGSVAHGTAVPGHFDIDLIALSPDLLPTGQPEVGEKKYEAILEQMITCLKRSLKNHFTISNIKKMYHGWCFKCWHFKVDLQLSPPWEQPTLEDMYDYLRTIQPSKRALFACGSWEFQNNLIGNQEHRVKVLIKRIKYWRNIYWPIEENGCPKSYFLSLLVIISCKKAPPKIRYSKRLRTLAKWVANDIRDLVKRVPHNPYLDLHVPGENPIIMDKYQRDLPEEPRIIDPANPFKNLYKQGLRQINPQQEDNPEKRWQMFVSKIETLNLVINLT